MKRHIVTFLLLLLAGASAAMALWLGRYLAAMNFFGGGASDIDKAVGMFQSLFGVAVLLLMALAGGASLACIYLAIRWWLSVR